MSPGISRRNVDVCVSGQVGKERGGYVDHCREGEEDGDGRGQGRDVQVLKHGHVEVPNPPENTTLGKSKDNFLRSKTSMSGFLHQGRDRIGSSWIIPLPLQGM